MIHEFLSTIPMCSYYGKPWLAGLHLLGNIIVFGAYMAIPIAIERVRRKRKDFEFGALMAMFALFIMLCGIGHLLTAIALVTNSDFWHWINTSNDLLTGAVSVATAIYAFKLIPTLVSWPTPEQYAFAREIIQVLRDREFWTLHGKPPPTGRRRRADGNTLTQGAE